MSYRGKFATHSDITRAVKLNEKDGLCPVCRKKPTAFGITCGENKCMSIWITGSVKKWNESGDLSDRADMRHLIK